MSVYKPKHSSIYKYDFRFQGHRFYGSTGQKTRRAAEQVEAQIRARTVLDDRPGKKPFITLDQAAAIYEDKLAVEDKWTPNEEAWVMRLVMALGPKKWIHEIQQHELAGLAARRAGEVSGSSVNREIDVWRSLWRKVMHSHEIGTMPDWGAMRYAVQAHHPHELRREDDQALLDAMREDLRDFFAFLLASGWRVTEARQLTWSGVDFDRCQARIVNKGRDEIVVPLSTEMIAIIARQPRICPQVFTYIAHQSRMKRRKGERYPLSRDGWRKEWHRARKAAGLEGVRVHDLRHTLASRVQRASGNLRVTQGALHHKSIQSTLRYIHASQEDVLQGLEAATSPTRSKDLNRGAG